MNRILALSFCLSTALFCNTLTASAQSGFNTPAPHAIIMDYETGSILFEKDARLPIAPASMTKIVTAELVFDAIRQGRITLDTEFTVSEEAWRRGGAKSGSSTMFLDLGSKVAVRDLLKGVIIQSGNDACIVLAEGLAGSETAFADMMTQHARSLGFDSATFRNSTGWPHPEHNISLYDLARYAQRFVSEYPEFYSLYSERSFTWNGITQSNRNPLLGRFTGADGLKTGHTESSGYGLVGSAKRGEDRRIMVVNGLGSKSERREESVRLMQAAFDSFDVYDLYKAGDVVESIDVFMGAEDAVEAVVTEDVVSGLYRPDRTRLKTQIRYKAVAAPVTKGDVIADLIIQEPGRDIRVVPLVAANDVKQKSAFSRVISVLVSKIRG
ncbi:D-alanyl-D-alanine carboxypeptidase family protein [Fretibacter rubidus]|uniref:D-alanyl-D-alanine carboxypeptidase family protein n=1 Tax=Fretibacter rubidus TaxID=570162 RepID=UPI00352A4D34